MKVLIKSEELTKLETVFTEVLGGVEGSEDLVKRLLDSFEPKPAIPNRVLNREDVLNDHHPQLTVGDLKRHITKNEIPDSAPVLIERVEDTYYERNNWGVLLKGGYHYHQILKDNERTRQEIERRARGEEPHYPGIKDSDLAIIDRQEILDEFKNQYTPSWSCVKYEDEDSILFIDLHY